MRAALLRLHSGITLTGTLVVHLRIDAFGLVLVPPLAGYIRIDDGVLGTSLCGSVSSLKKAFTLSSSFAVALATAHYNFFVLSYRSAAL